jgi:tubulin monoglycylase TTLL3/8
MIAIVAAAKRKLMNKKGTYELLGCDILVGDDLQPYLLEVNTNPAMFTDTQVQKELLPKLMRNTLGLVLDLFENENS